MIEAIAVGAGDRVMAERVMLPSHRGTTLGQQVTREPAGEHSRSETRGANALLWERGWDPDKSG